MLREQMLESLLKVGQTDKIALIPLMMNVPLLSMMLSWSLRLLGIEALSSFCNMKTKVLGFPHHVDPF